MALKIARLPEFNTNIEGEQHALAELRAQLDEPVRRGIPAPLGTYRHGSMTVGIETCARGQSLFVHGWIYALADGLLNDLEVTVGQG